MAVSLIIPLIEGTDQLVFQRRDGQAPTDANLLGFFGGGIEDGETPLQGALREINEETSLGVVEADLIFQLSSDALTARGSLLTCHLYTIVIPEAKFEVYEGAGFEVYTKAAVLKRDDLSPVARHLLELLP